MKKTEHVGTVIEVSAARAVVEFRTAERCGLGMQCACCTGAHAGSRRLVVCRGGLNEGDRVRLRVPVWLDYVAALVLFVMPVAFFVVGAVIASGVTGQADGGAVLGGGLAGTALAVVIALLVNRKLADPSVVEVERLGPAP